MYENKNKNFNIKVRLFVFILFFRKQWLLFPPSSSNFLQPTRIPYEESTIYSKYNFFCPTKEDEINILKIQDTARLVTLEPGDVLFVPPGWWHYVESLELTVSVNIWLPIITDNISRVKEAIVKLIVTRIGKDVNNVPNDTDCIDLVMYNERYISVVYIDISYKYLRLKSNYLTAQHCYWGM